MFALSAIPAALVCILLTRLPDTPRWYALRGRRDDAARTLARIDPGIDVGAELADIEEARRAERGGSVRQMFRKPYLRATLFVVGLGFLVQISGINAIVYFTPLIFAKIGLTGYGAELLVRVHPAGRLAGDRDGAADRGPARPPAGSADRDRRDDGGEHAAGAPETKGGPLEQIRLYPGERRALAGRAGTVAGRRRGHGTGTGGIISLAARRALSLPREPGDRASHRPGRPAAGAQVRRPVKLSRSRLPAAPIAG